MSGLRELKVGGISLLTQFGVWISGDNVFNGAEPSVETVKIPGRNGDLIFQDNRFNNFQIKYPCLISKDFMSKFPDLRAFLYSETGYRVISDSYFPGMHRMGRIVGASNPTKISWSADVAFFTITFDCKPQHYLDESNNPTIVESGTPITIQNPYRFDAKPLITLELPTTDPGSSSVMKLTINEFAIVIDHSIYTDLPASERGNILIDFEVMDAYYYDNNLNKYILDANEGDFGNMKFKPGNNIVSTLNVKGIIWQKRFWTL